MPKNGYIETTTNTLQIMNARNGKIARLPRSVREELNERLEQSEQSPQLLSWLNALPEVKKILQNDFAGLPISPQNLSQWRQGGFQEWLARRDLCEDALEVRRLAEEMDDEDSPSVLADDVAQVLAARFGSLIANWNGEVDDQFEAKSRVLNRLCRSVVQLQRGMHRANREAFELTCKLEDKETADEEALKDKMVKPCYDMLKLPLMVKMFGGGAVGRKIAQYILAVRRGNLDADLDLLPTDKYGHEEAAEKKAKPVKPTRKERPVKHAKKTKPDNVAKPLEDNEIDCGKEEESSQVQSNPVKVNQTDYEGRQKQLPVSTSAEGGLPRHSRCGDGGSNSVKVNQTDLVSPDNGGFGGLGNDQPKETPQDGSGPPSPTRPTRPTRPTPPKVVSKAIQI